MKVAETAYLSTRATPIRYPDAYELRKLSEQLDTRSGSFLFAHARLAWLESHGERELP